MSTTVARPAPRGRVRRGFRLAADSWAVLRADRSLVLFPVVGFLAATAAALVLVAPGVVIDALTDVSWPVIPFAVAAAYAATFLSLSMGVALAGAAAESMEGRDTTLRDGLAVARARRGAIARWALVQLTVGLVLNVLQGLLAENGIGRLIGAILTSLLSAAWSVLTFFVIPVLAFEDVGPRDALRRSGALVRERWGEGVVGSASITGVILLVALAPVVLLAFLAGGFGGAAGIACGAVAALIGVAAVVLGTALSSVFRVALYRYAVDGVAHEGFAEGDLAGAFRARRRR